MPAAKPKATLADKISVYCQEGIDVSVYFTPEVKWHRSKDPESGQQVFLVFVPSNGHDRGRTHCVPIHNVVRIVNGEAA
jgi:hypothetical protein